MREKIDPYSQWLGLPEGPRPPHLYALLGLLPFANDVEAVLESSRRQMACIKPYEDHPEPIARRKVQEIMNQIGMARAVLRDAVKKAEYDRRLREHLQREGLLPEGEAEAVQPDAQPAGQSSEAETGPGSLTLTVVSEGGVVQRTVHPDPELSTVLGRDASCTIQLDDRSVKPRHARVYCRHGRWYAAREDPRAEIVVNGQPCTRALLADGDSFGIGPFEIKVSKE
jgi:hypothetical protein